MLLQSHNGNWMGSYKIHLLPALPKAWSEGEIKGLIARGGFKVDMKWKDGKLIQVRIFSKKREMVKVVYNGEVVEFRIVKESLWLLSQA